MASVETCVKDLLCGLSNATRAALSGILDGYVAQLGILEAALLAKLQFLNILTVPPQLANTLVQAALSEAKAAANIIPLDLIGQCAGMGKLNESIQTNIDALMSDVSQIATDLSRLASFTDELNAQLDDVRGVIQYYKDILATIEICSQENT